MATRIAEQTMNTARGLPGELMLLFTFLVLVFFMVILLSNPHNKTNLWCFAAGMLFSVGVLKEYLYYTLGPTLIEAGYCTAESSEGLYSVLSAVFYYCAMPTMLIFGFYFAHIDRDHPKWFRRLRALCYVPAALFFLVVPCSQTRQYQFVPDYCLAVGLYNWALGAAFVVILLRALYAERLTTRYRQRKMAALCILLPLVYWLISAFPWHVFGITFMLKAWQGNLFVIGLLMLFFLYHAFKDGIWGVRFRKETYDWTEGTLVMQRNAHYVGHALKNELSKIEWCISLLREQGNTPRELDIIEKSTTHLREFIRRTQLYSDEIQITPEECRIREVFQEVLEGVAIPGGKRVSFQIVHCDEEPLWCDRVHLAEVLRNLVDNGVEAICDHGGGRIELSYRFWSIQGKACIYISDNGRGMTSKETAHVFEPYYTTKAAGHNLGLGLYYCWNVMDVHGGSIQVRSTPGQGSTFVLYFPAGRKKRTREALG